jgi:hypothetical protein
MQWYRFSVRTMLRVTFVGAVFFAGYHLGFHARHTDGADSTTSRMRVVLSTGTSDYPLSDRCKDFLWSCRLRSQPTSSYLFRVIETTVTWEDVGGPGSLGPFPGSGGCTLVVGDTESINPFSGNPDDPFAFESNEEQDSSDSSPFASDNPFADF